MTVLKNIRHEKFAQLVASGRRAGEAFVEANDKIGPPSDADRTQTTRWLSNVAITDRIAEIKAAAATKAEWTIADALDEYRSIVQADVNELIGTRIGACRFCHGEGHQYHWKEREYLIAVQRAEAADPPEPLPDPAGGFGYRFSDPPHPMCPECEGEGVARIVPQDTRKLSPIGRLLYQGVKRTKDGIEIKIADKDKAREQANRIIGAFVDRKEISGPGGVPINVTITPDDANL